MRSVPRLPVLSLAAALPLALILALLNPGSRSVAGDLEERALRLADEMGLDRDTVAFHFVAPGGRVCRHRAVEPMIPASCLKLVTATAALELLGSGFMVRTDLLRSGRMAGEVLEGDLIVVGRGDPGISGRYDEDEPLRQLERWCALLRDLGVTEVAGRLLADGSYLSGPVRHPDWPSDQLDRWFAAPSGALNLNDNCVDVRISPSADRSRIEVSLRPECSLFTVHSKIVPAARETDHLYSVDRASGSWDIELRGKFLRTVSERVEWITVPDPTAAFLQIFRQLLAARGIRVRGENGVVENTEQAVLVDSIARPVAALMPALLKHSQNLYGDCLLRIVGREGGGDGSFEAGSRRIADHWRESLGLSGTLQIRDGSGLSRESRVAADQLVEILAHASKQEWFPVFRDSLAVAGLDGTLRQRFRQSPLKGRVLAKTGHVQGVSTLAGYVLADSGELLPFAILYNGPPARIARARTWQERVLEELAGVGAPLRD